MFVAPATWGAWKEQLSPQAMNSSRTSASQGPNGHDEPRSKSVENILRRGLAGRLTVSRVIEELQQIYSKTRLPPVVSATDLCANPPPTPPEVIEGILHQGSKLAFGGGSKSFKTWALLQMAICVAIGSEWLGFQTTAGRVLYVNFELPEFSIEKRIREICEAMRINIPENLKLWNLRGHATDAATILPAISHEAKSGGFALNLLDPLYKLLGRRDENASRDMTDLMNEVERLAVDTEAAVGFGSHYSKGNQAAKESIDRISGSGVFARDPDSLITLTHHEVNDAFTVEMTLRTFPPREPFVVRWQHPLMVIDGKLDPTKLRKPFGRGPEHTPEDILKHFAPGMKTGEWKDACEEEGIKERTFYRLRKELVKAGRIFRSELDHQWACKAQEFAAFSSGKTRLWRTIRPLWL
jgi:hypothetical protein